MKKFIFPVVCAVLLTFLIRSVNPNLEAAGYIMVSAFGLLIGSGINKLAFKKESAQKSKENSVSR
jgi:hypothetical protein